MASFVTVKSLNLQDKETRLGKRPVSKKEIDDFFKLKIDLKDLSEGISQKHEHEKNWFGKQWSRSDEPGWNLENRKALIDKADRITQRYGIS